MNTKLNLRVRNAAQRINKSLEYLIIKFKQQFKFRNVKPEDFTAGIILHTAQQLHPILKHSVQAIKQNAFELRLGLLESGERKADVRKIEKKMMEAVNELKRLENYFMSIIKKKGELPKFTLFSRLGKYNRIPMLRWIEELENDLLRSWKKFVGLEAS